MTILAAGIAFAFLYIGHHASPFSREETDVAHPYFDYILILAGLLIVALFTYVQVYFGLVEMLLNWSSLLTAILFFFMAYRYDNRALLAMGITALAAAVGLSISPVDWVQGEWMATMSLYGISVIMGLVLMAVALASQKMLFKKHFAFTYYNFGLLLFFGGCLSAMFTSEMEIALAIVTLVAAVATGLISWRVKEFLFFVYAGIAGYVAMTYLFIKLAGNLDSPDIYRVLLVYFPVSTITFAVLLFRNKSHFNDD